MANVKLDLSLIKTNIALLNQSMIDLRTDMNNKFEILTQQISEMNGRKS